MLKKVVGAIKKRVKNLLTLTAILIAVSVLFACGDQPWQADLDREYGDTKEFENFLQERGKYESLKKSQSSGGHEYLLENGILSFYDNKGQHIWSSNKYWYVEDFELFDVDGDGEEDCLFSLWKSYSYYEGANKEDDPTVRNHLFLYTIRRGHAKPLWASSNLPRPILAFELSEGTKTPAYSGVVLKTKEGSYDHFSLGPDFTGEKEVLSCSYIWKGWGFTPVEPEVTTVKISFVGDLMVHQRQLLEAKKKAREAGDRTQEQREAYDFSSVFEPVKKELMRADYLIGNLETVFAGKEIPYNGSPPFNSPDEFAYALREAGFDMVTTANNHSFDWGEKGLLRTLDILDKAGLAHSGSYRSKEERNDVEIKEIQGINFAFLSYCYGLNSRQLALEKNYLVNILNKKEIKNDIEKARLKGADFIIMLPHMGDEYALEAGKEWRDWADFMIESGADAVIASHPHIVQPIIFEDYVIAYSLGNFLSSQRKEGTDTGIILSLAFEKNDRGDTKIRDFSQTKTRVQMMAPGGKVDIKIIPLVD